MGHDLAAGFGLEGGYLGGEVAVAYGSTLAESQPRIQYTRL